MFLCLCKMLSGCTGTKCQWPPLQGYTGLFGNYFRFQDDNAAAYSAQILRDFIEGKDITALHPPLLSPHCNRFAHLFNELGRDARNQQNPPSNLRELHQSLMDGWHIIAPERLTRQVDCILRHLDDIVRNSEGPTGYYLILKGQNSILHLHVKFGQSETNVSYHIL